MEDGCLKSKVFFRKFCTDELVTSLSTIFFFSGVEKNPIWGTSCRPKTPIGVVLILWSLSMYEG